MASIQDLQRLKSQVESLRREIAHAQGALSEAMKNLKEEFGVDDLESAKNLLKKIIVEEQEKKTAFEKALESFEEEWGDELGRD